MRERRVLLGFWKVRRSDPGFWVWVLQHEVVLIGAPWWLLTFDQSQLWVWFVRCNQRPNNVVRSHTASFFFFWVGLRIGVEFGFNFKPKILIGLGLLISGPRYYLENPLSPNKVLSSNSKDNYWCIWSYD